MHAMTGALLLSACAADDPPRPPLAEDTPPARVALAVEPPAEKPVVVERAAPRLPPFAAPPPLKPPFPQIAAIPQATGPEQADSPTPRPEALVGLDPAQTEEILGPPTVTRELSPATIWSYSTPTCQLDLYFYMNMASKRLSALSYELKNQDGQSNDVLASQCLRQLTEVRRNVAR